MKNNKYSIKIIVVLIIFAIINSSFGFAVLSDSTVVPTQTGDTQPQRQQSKIISDYFADLNADYSWAINQIDYLHENNIIKGTGDNSYSPSTAIKRADFVLMMYRNFSFDSSITSTYSDVPQGSYYYDAVNKAKAAGITDDTVNFNPEEAITRQDSVEMLYRALKNSKQLQDENITADISQYSDANDIEIDKIEAVATLSSLKVIQGSDGAFLPKSTLTRAEMAVVFYNTITIVQVPATPQNSNTETNRASKLTTWDVNAASAHVRNREKKPYTIMIYMNGSDLESEGGAATLDMIEMLNSGVRSDNANIILFTGGTNRWQNNVIPSNQCAVWEIADGEIYEISGVGLVDMGNPGTLAGFIDFSINSFPAEKYGLIMWDHGGGSIAGYGHDEKFNNSSLSLLDMRNAFEASLDNEKLEFLGFDSCLMATVEMSVIASDYAKYLIASEDLEPGEGWDYRFFSVLNNNPSMDGNGLGMAVVDYFIDYYGLSSDQILTLSVIDLSYANNVMTAMGNLMALCSDTLITERDLSFRTLASKRNGTKTFGGGSPRDNECDMVDIGDMATKLSDIFPNETTNILSLLDKSVIYNRHNSNADLKGLSAYYIYGGVRYGNYSLSTYSSLNMDGDYTQYLINFFNMLNSNTTNNSLYNTNTGTRSANQRNNTNTVPTEDIITSELTLWKQLEGNPNYYIMIGIQNEINAGTNSDRILWPAIAGENVCMYKVNTSIQSSLHAIPASLNGKDCDIIVLFNEEYPSGKILGSRQQDGFIIQKGYDKFEYGDKISFYYQGKYAGTNNSIENDDWYKSDELIVTGELDLEWLPVPNDKFYYRILLSDIWHNEYFTDLVPAAQDIK